MTRVLTRPEYAKAKLPVPDESQALMIANSRYEDMGAMRVHVLGDALLEPVMIRNRKKMERLHVPSVDHITLDLLEEYGAVISRPLWVRPPLILPASWAPWVLEAGQRYLLASGRWSTPYVGAASKQAHWEWCWDQIAPTHDGERRKFLAPTFGRDAKSLTRADYDEMNVRLWEDARGPGHSERRAEIQGFLLRALSQGGSVEEYWPILPKDHSQALSSVGAPTIGENDLAFPGKEEALWASMLDDPDLDLFGLDAEESVEWETSRNLFMEADNLIAIKRLRRGYEGKVKLTYADPPYNTGNKFIYNDSFKSEANRGSPFQGIRWQRGTWLTCMVSPWVNQSRLSPRSLRPVDDEMMDVP